MSERPVMPTLPPLEVLGRPGPLVLPAALLGHVALVLFWRRGCVHSRHALQRLAPLQRRWLGEPFAMAAVHSAQEPWEDSLEAITAEAMATGETLLLLRDDGARAFAAAGSAGYPALFLLDEQGRVCFAGRGEPNADRLMTAVEYLLQQARDGRALAGVPLAPTPLTPLPAAPLYRPQGVCVLDGDTIAVAETGHHRLLLVDRHSGRVSRAIGSGIPGADDGPAAQARFRAPIGLAMVGDSLLVADSGNHALRRCDPARGDVATICGTGRPATDRHGGGFGVLQGLCSPVGLCTEDGAAVYLAQAGAHQVWQFDPETRAAAAWLGSGAAALRDGGDQAAFAQPWALCCSDGTLYVADAGNGALRAIDLGHTVVRTLAAGLVRPVGVAVLGDEVFVADAGRGQVLACRSDGRQRVVAGPEHGLVEPAALTAVGSHLLVADAGAHGLFECDPHAAGEPLRWIPLHDVPRPAVLPPDPRLATVLPVAELRAGGEVTLLLELPVARFEHVDVLQPASAAACNETGAVLAVEREGPIGFDGEQARIELALGPPGRGSLRLEVRATLRDANGSPVPRVFRFVLPVVARADGAERLVAAVPGR